MAAVAAYTGAVASITISTGWGAVIIADNLHSFVMNGNAGDIKDITGKGSAGQRAYLNGNRSCGFVLRAWISPSQAIYTSALMVTPADASLTFTFNTNRTVGTTAILSTFSCESNLNTADPVLGEYTGMFNGVVAIA